jgi:hypothetical protein
MDFYETFEKQVLEGSELPLGEFAHAELKGRVSRWKKANPAKSEEDKKAILTFTKKLWGRYNYLKKQAFRETPAVIEVEEFECQPTREEDYLPEVIEDIVNEDHPIEEESPLAFSLHELCQSFYQAGFLYGICYALSWMFVGVLFYYLVYGSLVVIPQ